MLGAQKTGSPTHLISQTYDATLRSLGRTFDSTEPMYGESAGAPAWPLRQLCMASKWLLMLPGCVIDRIRAKSLVILASRVFSSLIRMPGTAVAIGLYGPRISSGAPGFRSQVSRWLGPPHSEIKMHDLSAATPRSPVPGLTLAATVPGTAKLRAPIPPACNNRRREKLDMYRWPLTDWFMASPLEAKIRLTS